MVSHGQLLSLGLSEDAIKHRAERGRLHPVHRGVYAVGRPELPREGYWMAAVLRCGDGAVLSHESAAELWGILGARSHPGRGRQGGPADGSRRKGIPLTNPICTLVDLATRLTAPKLEAAINEADKRDLVNPEALRAALHALPQRPGVATLRNLLDRRTFQLTDSELERLFLPIVRRAGLPLPETGCRVNDFKVDFFWPKLGLVVETDGLRYHRTPAQQTKDRLRDQAHTAAGLTPLRFTHAQVRFEKAYVERTLTAVAQRVEEQRARLTSS